MFCELCKSLIIDGKCSNFRCANSDGKRLKAGCYGSKSEFVKNPKTGKLRDRETGTIVQGG